MAKPKVLIESMQGIGDCIYERPYLRHLTKTHEVYLETFLPELFTDIEGLKLVNPLTDQSEKDVTYRTQNKQFLHHRKNSNVKMIPKSSKEVRGITNKISPHYGGDMYRTNSIFSIFLKNFNINSSEIDYDWSLPDSLKQYYDNSPISKKIPSDKKIAIIRPPTVRSEWKVSTRNADPNYIGWCSKVLMEAGYFVIAIADIEEGKEWIVGNPPPCHMALYKGELGVYGTLDLIRRSEIVVGGPGFIVPAAVSTNTPVFVIFGGRMAYDNLYNIIHPSMNMKNIGWAIPDNPCRCTLSEHNCNKSIMHLDGVFYDFLREIQK